MLELRPNCEHCNTALPPEATDARICSFECTFCASCVSDVLFNVCPNCGGGFAPRPIRPSTRWNGSSPLGEYPATSATRHRPVDRAAHEKLAACVAAIPPQLR